MIALKKYRDKWMAETTDEFIGFYSREFTCFDNFSSYGLIYNGVKYATLEHAYQAFKFIDTAPEIAEQIADSLSAHEAKKIAHLYIDKQNPEWDNIKLDVMEKLLREKLRQNPHVVEKLLETQNYMICEDSPTDDFWGIGPDRNGQNHLGKLLMKLREELKNEAKPIEN